MNKVGIFQGKDQTGPEFYKYLLIYLQFNIQNKFSHLIKEQKINILLVIFYIYQNQIFMAIAIRLALIAGSNNLGLRHEQTIKIQSLTPVYKSTDLFIRSKLPNLSGSKLASGQQNGNDFTYQYSNENIPIALTQSKSTLLDYNKNIFKLAQATQTVSGPVHTWRQINFYQENLWNRQFLKMLLEIQVGNDCFIQKYLLFFSIIIDSVKYIINAEITISINPNDNNFIIFNFIDLFYTYVNFYNIFHI